MSIKTRAKPTAFIVALAVCAGPAQAAPSTLQDPARDFATCLGRFEAQEDYDRQMGRDVSALRPRTQMFGQLLEAVTPVHATGEVADAMRKQRAGAEGAHWALLHAADFSFDARQAEMARRAAQRNLDMCNLLVVG